MPALFNAATSSGIIAETTTKTWSHTCSGVDRFLLVGLGGWDFDSNIGAVTVTYNGVSVPKLGGQSINDNNQTVLWGLKNPASGAHNVVVSGIPITGFPATFSNLGGVALSFTGVHQTVATGTVVNAPTITVNVPGVISGDLVADVFFDHSGIGANPISPGVLRASQSSLAPQDDIPMWTFMSTRGGSGTVTAGYNAIDEGAISAVRIIQAPSGGAFVGALVPSASLAAGVAKAKLNIGGGAASQHSTVAGKANNLHFLGAIGAQGAVIVGDGLRIILHFDGALAAQSPLIADVIMAYINASGAAVSEAAVLDALFRMGYMGELTSEAGLITGHMTLERLRPPDNTDIRFGKVGRRFEIWIDQTR